MEKYKNLYTYYKHWVDNVGKAEHDMSFPNLIIWLREAIDNDFDKAVELFMMDDYEIEEFSSWGHNSRWAHVVEPLMHSWYESDEKSFRNMLIGVAEQYGDPDVEEKYFSKKDENVEKQS